MVRDVPLLAKLEYLINFISLEVMEEEFLTIQITKCTNKEYFKMNSQKLLDIRNQLGNRKKLFFSLSS
jgi:hypothetical protein